MPKNKDKTENDIRSAHKSKKTTVVKSLGQCSFSSNNGDMAAVDVKDGRIIRIRPEHYDTKYTKKDINAWEININGEILHQPSKGLLPAYQLAYKKRAYSPNRIMYPLKRVDWDSNGERNPQNRGKSKFKRISWDEATTIIANEIKRVVKKYGPYAVLCHGDGHGETKTVHGPHGCQMWLMKELGGYTLAVRNADSWEGWYWGAMHMWGGAPQVGLMPQNDNLLIDVTDHTQMLLHIGADLETTPWGFSGQFPSTVLFFWSKIGKKHIFVCPDLNYSAAIHADKWIPILPNTDAALQLAIAYTWIKEGTYDKDYVATHVVGFDKFLNYVMGKEDKVPKTPEWASQKCGVPEWTIKALAREWAQKITSTVHYYGGGYIRGPYSHEPARLEVCLLGMQGLGKPGVHQYHKMSVGGGGTSSCDTPRPKKYIERKKWQGTAWTGALQLNLDLSPQIIPKTLINQAILNPPINIWGSTLLYAPTEDQFIKYTYPLPKEQGGTEIHMVWVDNPCRTTCWNKGFITSDAYRNSKIETIVVQHPWLENDTVYADIILPVNTKLEEEDIACAFTGSPNKAILIEDQAIEPIGESLSDYEAVGEIAKKLGLYEKYTGAKIIDFYKSREPSKEIATGMSVQDRIKLGYKISEIQDLISWEKLREMQYYIFPTDPEWEKVPAGLRLFYEDPEKNPLETPTGKLEFYSQRLADHFPDDEERPPMPKWIEKGPSHDERLSSQRAKKYPLLLVSNHPRWRTHAQNDDITWLREIYTCKVKGWDGYMYEPVWIHPSDAAKRGIKNGDIVKLFNERGIVLGGAIVWERIMPGVVYQDHGARADLIVAGPDEYIDRGGANNLISPENGTSQNCWGMATSGYLVDVQKVSGEEWDEWRKNYPEAFERDYDPASGLRSDAWVIEEGGN